MFWPECKLTEKVFKKLAVIALLFFSIQAQALVVLQQASLSLGTEYDSNPSLSSKNKQSVWRYLANPSYKISAVQDQDRWYMNGGLTIERSSDKRISSDREDPNIRVGWEREYERGKFGIVGSYDKTSSRVSEFKNSGLVSGDGNSTTKSIGINWSRLLSEKLSLTTGSQLLNQCICYEIILLLY